jgi:hypothetical protein
MQGDRAKVAIIDQNSGKSFHVQLPVNVKTKQVLPALIRQLKLPTEGVGGEALQYVLALETKDGNVLLAEDDILSEAGVVDGVVMTITPVMPAGRSKTGDELLSLNYHFQEINQFITKLFLRLQYLEEKIGARDTERFLNLYGKAEESFHDPSFVPSKYRVSVASGIAEHSKDLLLGATDIIVTSKAWLEIQQPTMGIEQQQAIIQFISERTGVDLGQIKIVDIIPENTIITIEMPLEGARELLELYLIGDPSIAKFGIKKVEVRNETLVPLLPSRLDQGSPRIDYELGLGLLREALANEPNDKKVELYTLEARLREYLENEKLFGVSDTVREGRARVLYNLNEFVVRAGLGTSFTELCVTKSPPPESGH